MSISLNNFDLKQCAVEEEENETENNNVLEMSTDDVSLSKVQETGQEKSNKANRHRDPFYGTDNCDHVSTQV